ncbi:MAG: L,D-transpeptidase [Proteobacteria bacterium]|nr:L,D-transpeptidase [Pseudomonadota bacterium]
MATVLNRRNLVLGALALSASAAMAGPHPLYGGEEGVGFRDDSLLPPPESPIDFDIEQVDLSDIPERFRRQVVSYDGVEAPGTIIVDPEHRHLYLVLDNGSAIRYGVGVGRAGFAWSGEAVVGMKRRWPRWVPPEEMVYRDARAEKWVNGMPGGPENPLGARALYLYANGVDTLYRIHGTNEPDSIGKAMSSGCIRMLNQDVADLFERVPRGARVVVLPASA